MAKRVGLTGGVASGKSTVAKILAELGAVIIDADAIAREVVAVGTPGLDAVVAEFGREVLAADGSLDRPAMAERVFNDPAQLARLEAIVHPLVLEEIARQEAQAARENVAVVVHDIPLLAESGRADTFDEVIVVHTSQEQQIDRMTSQREWTLADAKARIAAQATPEERAEIATIVIDNTGTLDRLREKVLRAWDQLTAATAAQGGNSGPS